VSHIDRMMSTELHGQQLSGLDFRGSDLQLASFADCDLRGAVWDGARGELFDELDELRTKAEAFDDVDAERAEQESRADDAETRLTECECKLAEARAELADLKARLADLQAAQDRAAEASS